MILRGSKAKRRPQLKLKLKHNQIRALLLLFLENLSIEFCNWISKVLKSERKKKKIEGRCKESKQKLRGNKTIRTTKKKKKRNLSIIYEM